MFVHFQGSGLHRPRLCTGAQPEENKMYHYKGVCIRPVPSRLSVACLQALLEGRACVYVCASVSSCYRGLAPAEGIYRAAPW